MVEQYWPNISGNTYGLVRYSNNSSIWIGTYIKYGNDDGAITINGISAYSPFQRGVLIKTVWKWDPIVANSDLGGAVFSTATGAIKYGMNGIYLGKFSNGVEQPDGTGIFDACIYLIGTKLLETAVYAFPITQYIGGHLFFNRMGTNNQFELTSWKKLI